jgi:hypothetical protein
MRDLQALDAPFGIRDLVRFEAGEGGLPCALVTAPAADARIYLHGARRAPAARR